MTEVELFRKLKDEFQKIIEEKSSRSGWSKNPVPQRFLPEEAIGITERKDYPILDGSEVMLQAGIQRLYRTGIHFLTCCFFRYAAGNPGFRH